MYDPRIEEVLGHLGDIDVRGNPTELAQVAARVRAHVQAVEQLRAELAQVESGIAEVENRAQVLAESLSERARHRADLQYEAQDTAVRAALSGSASGAAHLRRQAQGKRKNIEEFERDFAEDQKRLEHAKETLKARQSQIKLIRDQIARRMNTIDTLLHRADVAWPRAIQAGRKRGSATAMTRPPTRPVPRRPPRSTARGNTRRVVLRRRKAS